MDKTFTYQTRLTLELSQAACLSAMSSLYNKIEHTLFAAFNRGESLIKAKNSFIRKYGITARHYNAIRIGLEGKIKACQTLQQEHVDDLATRIKKLKGSIKYISGLIAKGKFKPDEIEQHKASLHHKRRRLAALQHKYDKLVQKKAANKVSLCFGTKKLFKKQFNLAENGYSSHEEWQQDWRDARVSGFMVVGSKDETMGNQSCIVTVQADNKLAFKIRVPDALGDTYGKYLVIKDVEFTYGDSTIKAAIQENIVRNTLSKQSERKQHGDLFKGRGQALTYRFVKDENGWRVFLAVEQHIEPTTVDDFGVIGVDINADHLAVCEINHCGNYIYAFNIPLVTYGKSTEQTKAIIGDAVKVLVEYAKSKQKPLVVEKLDFRARKKEIARKKPRASRMLSSFAYSSIITMLQAKAFREAVEVFMVNPAYSSAIGRVKFARIYSQISVHQASAMVIARRYFRFSERLPRDLDNIPLNNGRCGTLKGLVKISSGHVWRTWAKVVKVLQEVHAAQYQKFRKVVAPYATPVKLALPIWHL